ncbi:MAG: arginine decarboxylase [Myxococcota bacterium]|jgi:arginine decarboxylase|nr:arginine decarboxylase [Deltaproteobacteria bacterium]MCP4245208.1 arginine decarboxylase [bacterium]MDP7074364.1 arginine decarboxylase [Myxococcota bacterium]MDP7434117.1 arginine decarboxylase [Myxococcota bacterium]HJO24733.1 arginine decarboxylase [Myxococcota bacterium]
MIDPTYKPIRLRALIVDDGLAHLDTSLGRSAEDLARELEARNVDVVRALSTRDGAAVVISDAALSGVLLNWDLGRDDEASHAQARALLEKLRERHAAVPAFLVADREGVMRGLSLEVAELVDEYVWLLEDTADFVAGRVIAAMKRYRAQLLPPFAKALGEYSQVREYSWSAPGHQGGVAFTKLPPGRLFFDFYGENLFRTDMGIERGQLGSLLDHSGPVADSEAYAARVFGADRSYSVVVGTSGSNRTIMQACMKEDDLVVADRNCHKSIEQGLILTGARPIYLIPTRNRYGIIGPIPPEEMSADALRRKTAESPLTNSLEQTKPVYSVVTNCTYDGLCYNAARAQELLQASCDRIHFDEAWYGYARFNPMYADHYAMRGNPADHTGPTVFATHSSHKLLAALSQASYIHIRDGAGSVDHDRFNQAYMMHATTSPLYAIIASNDIASAMMDGPGGRSLTQEVIDEAVDFRQTVARMERQLAASGDWFFKPWNADSVTDPADGQVYEFADAPRELLTKGQDAWIMRPEDTWHGFDGIAPDWCMLDPIKVSLLSPGMGQDGQLLERGVPAALVNAYFTRFGIVPTRVTDFQIMFIFSIGVTKGKWGTLLTNLLSFKRHYDANDRIEEVLPDLAARHPDRYANLGIRELGDEMFQYLKEERPGDLLNKAYSTLPTPDMTHREAYNSIVSNQIEKVSVEDLAGRTAANGVIPYPPGIPMLMSGENFGNQESPQIGYLRALQTWDERFPSFEHETEGAEVIDGKYHVMCTS